MDGEAALIDRAFGKCGPRAGADVPVGIGDDCALVTVPSGVRLALTMDTIIAGVHFPRDTAAADVGWKALACSLSDLAAAGARPAWATLSVSLPAADEAWLTAFAGGFGELLERHDTYLVGGDLVRGSETSITVTAGGYVETGYFLARTTAAAGDDIYVSGWPGEAAAALALARPPGDALRRRLDRPCPRVALGRALLGTASACIDVSDGLAHDLARVLLASGVGATLDESAIPVSDNLRMAGDWETILDWILHGGDDYELIFTAPPAARAGIAERADALGPVTRIGRVEAERGLRLQQRDGSTCDCRTGGYDHFFDGRRDER